MKKTSRWYWGAFAAGLLTAAWPLLAPAPKAAMDVAGFARLPLLEGGRVKPMDSFARNALLLIRGTQTLPVDGKTMSAVEWMLNAMFKPERADTLKVFVIDDPDVLGLLGLEQGNERRFAYWQIEPKRDEVGQQAQRAEAIDSSKRSRFQSAVVNLSHRLDLYEQIKNTFMISGSNDPTDDLAAFSAALPGAMRAVHGAAKASRADQAAMKVLSQLLERYQFLARAAAFRALPPQAGEPDEAWTSFGEGILKPNQGRDPHPGVSAYALMGHGFRKDDPAAFRSAVREFSAWLASARPEDARRARQEVVFNAAQPFVAGMTLYVLALLAVFAWWGTRRAEAQSAGGGLLAAAVLVHTVGLFARVALQGRPPVTNLYSSAVFVGWVSAALGLFAERVHKKGFAHAGGALVGFSTLLIAQHLSASGDTMEMMRAVLDSNFWLATHVVTVTIGYASTFLAGALGIAWVLRRQFLSKQDPETTRALVGLCYGIVAFSLFFSFVGTVLGGIWADQSWGRFWGWDPKENGALLIVLWNALILHARFAGYARERGVMVMAVFGNIVTALSWFGVNMLGIGLHSYGFMDKAFYWLTGFCAVQLAFMWLGWMPARFWREPDAA
ncbi:MAG: cytochrome c biogenesis protein CcsA [Elusimicrobia bacterium]|nr:cytochrome c biogenesis protein CcsA [Elusimicrobiota bacterium]